MTNTWHRYATYRLQADDFLKYFSGLLAAQDFGNARWAIDWHPYVGAVAAIYGSAKIDELRKDLKAATDKATALQDMIF